MQTICTLLQTGNHTNTSSLNFYQPDALPDAQPTVSEHLKASVQSNLAKTNVSLLHTTHLCDCICLHSVPILSQTKLFFFLFHGWIWARVIVVSLAHPIQVSLKWRLNWFGHFSTADQFAQHRDGPHYTNICMCTGDAMQ